MKFTTRYFKIYSKDSLFSFLISTQTLVTFGLSSLTHLVRRYDTQTFAAPQISLQKFIYFEARQILDLQS